MSQMKQDLVAILPQIAILLTAVVALVFEMLRRPRGSFLCVVVGMGAIACFALSRLGMDTTAFSETFRVDSLSIWAVLILCPSCLVAALMARHELKGSPREGTLYSLLAFSTLGSALLAGAGDLMFIVLGVLMNGLSGFALAAHTKTEAATEGAVKYFVYGSVTGAIMVFGLAYWVGVSGSTLLSSMPTVAEHPYAYAFGFLALVAGTGYAASLFPFHFWTPDTFQGAPSSIAGFLSVTPKIGALFALAQVASDIPVSESAARNTLAIIGAASMTFGNLVALRQADLTRLLAYSTVAQTGYFLLALVAPLQDSLSRESLIVFGGAYAAMNLGAFAIAARVPRRIDQLGKLGRREVWPAFALTVFLFSLVGIPPLFGFAGKLLLFRAAIDGGFAWFAVVGILNSVLSLAVYLRIIHPLYFSQPGGEARTTESSACNTLAWSACLLATLVGGPLVHFIIVGG